VKSLKGIKNIVFDLGGVIINLNQELTFQHFKAIFNEDFPKIWEEIQEKNILERFETGELSNEDFISFFQQQKPELTTVKLMEAWNSMLLDIPAERISLIEELRKEYNIYLLSNTNEIHYSFIENYYQTEFKAESFMSLFKKVYLSHEMGLRKPDVAIFEKVLSDSNLIASETLFIDDSLEHIKSAKKVGIITKHINLEKDESLIKLFT